MKIIHRVILTFFFTSLFASFVLAQEEGQQFKKAMKEAGSVYRSTSPNDILKFNEKTLEAYNYVTYLGCLGGIPFLKRDDVASFEIMKWPLSSLESPSPFVFTIKYPLTLAVKITPKDNKKGVLFAVVKQRNSHSLLEMTEGWIESETKIKTKVPVPSSKLQHRANAELLRLMKEWESTNNKGLKQTDCVSS